MARSARAAVVAGDVDEHDIPGDPDQEAGDPIEVARLICLNQLSARARTRSELETTLRKRGVPDEAAEYVLDRLSAVGLVDDVAFAETWVRSRQRERGLAKAVIKQELHRKGVAPEVAQNALEQLDPGLEREAAQGLVRKKLPSTRGLATDARVRRLVGMLARKGYSSGLSFAVVKEALAAEGEELDHHLGSGED